MSVSVTNLLEKTARDSKAWDLPKLLTRSDAQVLSFLNAHAVTTSSRQTDFGVHLMESDWLLRDGIGIKMGLRIFGLGKTENLNGTDLITTILDQTRDRDLVIYGSSDETMARTRKKLQAAGHTNLVETAHGFHDDSVYVDRVVELKPQVVLLCMGMPRQEILAGKLRNAGFEGLAICGGGWADFYSLVKPRAPLWMRKFGMEWIFRFMLEPRRLGKRYTVDILVFFYVVAKARLRG